MHKIKYVLTKITNYQSKRFNLIKKLRQSMCLMTHGLIHYASYVCAATCVYRKKIECKTNENRRLRRIGLSETRGANDKRNLEHQINIILYGDARLCVMYFMEKLI